MGTFASPFLPRRHRIVRRLSAVLAFSVVAALLTGAVPAGAVMTPFFAMDGAQEAILSEMAIHPSTARIGHVVYVAYQGPGYDPYIASYDESTRVWHDPVRVGTNLLRLDAHGAPALFVDSDGFIHVFYGCHFMTLLHAVSAAPRSIDRWRQLPPVSTDATYPQPIGLPDGTLVLFFRQGGYDLYAWAMRVSYDNGLTWEDGEFPVLAGQSGGGDGSFYAHFAVGAGGIVHCAFTRFDPSKGTTWLQRRNVYYIWRDTDGIWYNAQGRSVTMPVTLKVADSQCKVMDSGPGAVNEVVVKEEPKAAAPLGRAPEAIATTTPGTPLIQFITGANRGPGTYRWEFARWIGSAWATSTITSTDHNFDAATFDPHADGTIDSYLVTGGSESQAKRNDGNGGRGGRLEHWTSTDHGKTWSFVQIVSPIEAGSLFNDPQIVPDPSSDATVMFTDWNNDRTDFFHRMYLWGPAGFAGRTVTPRLDRAAGTDRVGTSVAVSRAAFAEGADYVLLATSANFPDALTAGPLAAALGAPVLLVPGGFVPSSVAGEIKRLKATHAIILGSTGVIPASIDTPLRAAGVTDVQRIAGPDRYATSLAVATRVGQMLGPLGTAVVVSGQGFADALSAGPLAAYNGFPIILARGDAVPGAVTAAFVSLGVTSTIVVGGTSVVSRAYADGLPSPARLSGSDRYLTSEAVARYSLGAGLLPYRVILASGTRFPDGLTGAILGSHARAPLLLVSPVGLTQPTADVLGDIAGRNVQSWVLGGPSVVTNQTAQKAAGILGAQVKP